MAKYIELLFITGLLLQIVDCRHGLFEFCGASHLKGILKIDV